MPAKDNQNRLYKGNFPTLFRPATSIQFEAFIYLKDNFVGTSRR